MAWYRRPRRARAPSRRSAANVRTTMASIMRCSEAAAAVAISARGPQAPLEGHIVPSCFHPLRVGRQRGSPPGLLGHPPDWVSSRVPERAVTPKWRRSRKADPRKRLPNVRQPPWDATRVCWRGRMCPPLLLLNWSSRVSSLSQHQLTSPPLFNVSLLWRCPRRGGHVVALVQCNTSSSRRHLA